MTQLEEVQSEINRLTSEREKLLAKQLEEKIDSLKSYEWAKGIKALYNRTYAAYGYREHQLILLPNAKQLEFLSSLVGYKFVYLHGKYEPFQNEEHIRIGKNSDEAFVVEANSKTYFIDFLEKAKPRVVNLESDFYDNLCVMEALKACVDKG